jgi:hypothetical protein
MDSIIKAIVRMRVMTLSWIQVARRLSFRFEIEMPTTSPAIVVISV